MDSHKIRSVTLDQHDDLAVLDVVLVEIDTPALAREFGSELEMVIQMRPADRILLDFSRTKYMSSTAFAVILGFGRRAGDAGIQVSFSGFIPAVRFGADVLGIGRIIPIHETRAAAVKALRQA
ncbi:MAG: STAS domain-containing protein [Isosphaeraceae bacterium]|nr:STAS domain-containing protein [Isosphaeraceae bacterium]